MSRGDYVLIQEGRDLVVYDARASGNHDDSNREGGLKRRILSLGNNAWLNRLVGAYFLALALIGTFSFIGPILLTEVKLRFEEGETPRRSKFAQLMWEDGSILSPESQEFGLVIPRIGVNTKVVTGVNAADKSEYLSALSQGVAHAAGSSLPSENGLIYLFGHSTDYLWNVPELNAVFYQLKDLESGDLISIIYQGERFDYKVSDNLIVEADDLSILSPVKEEKLVLQTCWPPGTTWKRLLIVAQPVENTL